MTTPEAFPAVPAANAVPSRWLSIARRSRAAMPARSGTASRRIPARCGPASARVRAQPRAAWAQGRTGLVGREVAEEPAAQCHDEPAAFAGGAGGASARVGSAGGAAQAEQQLRVVAQALRLV